MNHEARILHLIDALTTDRRERGALLYQLRDCLDVHLVCREEVCSHGVRAVLGKRCGEVKRENAHVRAAFGKLIETRDHDAAFLSAARELRRTIERLRPIVEVERRAA